MFRRVHVTPFSLFTHTNALTYLATLSPLLRHETNALSAQSSWLPPVRIVIRMTITIEDDDSSQLSILARGGWTKLGTTVFESEIYTMYGSCFRTYFAIYNYRDRSFLTRERNKLPSSREYGIENVQKTRLKEERERERGVR